MAQHILLIQTAFIGDLLLSIPLLREIKKQWPEHQLHVLCRQGLAEFLKKTQLVDEAIEVNKTSKVSWKNAKTELKKYNYSYIFCPHESLTSAKLVWQLQSTCKIGFKNIHSIWAFHKKVKKPITAPDAIRQLSLLLPVTKDIKWKEQYHHYLDKISQADKAKLETLVPEWASMSLKKQYELSTVVWRNLVHRLGLESLRNKPWIILVPGSMWATKMWRLEYYQELAADLENKNYQVICLGSPAEKSLASEVIKNCKSALNLAGLTSLYESALLMSNAKAVVSNDSGAMHLASTTETPTIALFGPTVLSQGFRPWQNKALVLENLDLKCRPCGRHGHQKCPIGTHECMKSIKPQQVQQGLESLL